ncbi:MAG: hypothetical protein ACI9VR_002428 [Cognaticolwellia sp.]|jgi:hypothetical protein
MLWMTLVTLLACDKEGEIADEPQINGTVSTVDGEAQVAIYRAFGFHTDDGAVFYFTSTPDSDCPMVAEYLSSKQVDPQDIWAPGTCNLSAVLPNYDPAGTTVSRTPDEPTFDVTWNVRCALGEGAFEWGKRDEGSDDEDYFWAGPDAVEWWGSGLEFTATFSGEGTQDDPYIVDIPEMTQFSGNYPAIFGDIIPADGVVSGSIEAQTCDDLYGTYIFQAL